MARRAAQCARALAADVDWRPGLLDCLRLKGHWTESKELAVVFDHGFRPEPLADGETLVEAPPTRRWIQTGGCPLFAQPTRTNPNLSPAARYDIERLDRASRSEWVAEPQQVDAGSEADALGLAREEREPSEGVEDRRCRGDRRVLRPWIRRARHCEWKNQVLGHPDGFEAKPLGFEGHRKVIGGVERPEPDPELQHGSFPSVRSFPARIPDAKRSCGGWQRPVAWCSKARGDVTGGVPLIPVPSMRHRPRRPLPPVDRSPRVRTLLGRRPPDCAHPPWQVRDALSAVYETA